MTFSSQSMNRFDGVNPRLVQVLNIVRQRTGIPFEITEGLRDKERQRQLVAEGKSQTLNSRHLHGNATDIHILNPDGSVNWDFEAYRPIAEMAKQVASELGYNDLVWGGDWKTLKDGVHFQMGGSHAGHSHATGDFNESLPHHFPENALAGQLPEQQNALAVPQLQLRRNRLDPEAFMLPQINRLS